MNPTTSQQPYMTPQTVYATQSPLSSKMEKYKTYMVKLGVAEIVLGVIIFVFDIAILSIAHDVGQGIWCGSILIACGIVGVVTRSQQSYCMFSANMVLSSLAAVFMILLVILSCLYTAWHAHWYWYLPSFVILESMIAAMSFLALVITILHFAYSCAGVCTGNPNSPTQVLMPVQMSNGQVILNPNQMSQPAVYSGYANHATDMPTSSNQLSVLNSATVGLPAVQSTESVLAQEPECADPPPSYSYNP